MDTTTLITNYLLYSELLPSATTGAYVVPRRRAKRNAQRIVDWVNQQRAWSWKLIPVDVVISAGSGDLPANFLTFGRNGGVWPDVGRPPLTWRPVQQVLELQKTVPNSGTPMVYTVGNQDQTTGVKKLLTYPTGGATLHIVYERTPPRLKDAAAGMADPETVDELQLIPAAYHETVVYEGLVWYGMKDKANQQSVTEQRAIFMAGFKSMVENERAGQEAPHRVIPYGAGRR